MSTEQNIQIARKGYADFSHGDIPAVLAGLADDIIWVAPDIGMPPGGTKHGKAGVAEFFEEVAAAWEFQSFEPKEFIASGDRVAVQGSYAMTSKATGRQGACDWVMVWTIKDGKVVHFQEYTDSALLLSLLKA